MNFPIEGSLLSLEAGSAQELDDALTTMTRNGLNGSAYASLSLRDPGVLVRPFKIDDCADAELREKLLFEAVELLSLPTEDIELEFQVLKTDGNNYSGIFMCMPRILLKEYLSVLNKKKLYPFKITSSTLADIDNFFQERQASGERFCLFDFSRKNSIKLVSYQDQQCDLLREVPYEHPL